MTPNSFCLRIVVITLVSSAWANFSLAADAGGASQLSWDVTVDTRFEDNIGFASDEPSERETSTTRISGGLTWLVRETSKQRIIFSARPFFSHVESLEDLSHYGMTGALSWRQQFNANFTAPFVQARLEGKWLEHYDSEIRDGYILNTELAIGKQFNPIFGASIGARYTFRESTEDDPIGTVAAIPPTSTTPLIGSAAGTRNSDEVFDLQTVGGFVKFEINPAARTAIFVEYSYVTGDVAASGSPLGFNQPEAFDAAREFAFEEGIEFLSYRIDADQQIYSMGLSQSITDKLQLDIAGSYLDAEGEYDNNYDNLIGTLGLTWNF